MENLQPISIQTTVNAPIEKVWNNWTDPETIKKWNNASEDWHTPYAENDIRKDGKFLYRMAAKDASFQFDFSGVYDEVELYKSIKYRLDDGRKVEVNFLPEGNKIKITETFDPEESNPIELQKAGWQAILDSFKKYTETH